MTLKNRVSLEQKIEFLSYNWVIYELSYWNVNDKPSHVLIVKKWIYEWATYWSKSISRLIDKLYKDVIGKNEPKLITNEIIWTQELK